MEVYKWQSNNVIFGLKRFCSLGIVHIGTSFRVLLSESRQRLSLVGISGSEIS